MKCLKYMILILLVLNSLQSLGQQLMIISNIPHYLVQGDHIEFKVELSNLGDSELTGQVQLELTDSLNHRSVDGWLMNTFPNQYFTIAAGKRETVSFPIQIPDEFNRILKWRVSARTGSSMDTAVNHTLYQEGILPVLTNRMESSESYSLIIKDTALHQVQIKKLKTSGNNEAIENRLLQIEVSCDPSLFALVGMPEIVHQNRISMARLSESFFAACVLASSHEQTVNIDKQKWNAELKDILSTIKDRQMKNGAFPWIASGAEDLKSTIDFLTVVGRLKYLNAVPESIRNELNVITENAFLYADNQINKMVTDYKLDVRKWSEYFYMRSYYLQLKDLFSTNKIKMVLNVTNNPKQLMNKTDLIRLIIYLLRNGEIAEGKKLRSQINDQNYGTLPIEQLTLLLELYHEMHLNNIEPIIKSILQQQKEYGWIDASATLSPYYSLKLLQSSTQSCEPLIHLQIGSIHLYNTKEVEGKPISYFIKNIDGSFIKPQMGSVSISIQNTQQLPDKKAYATVFWSYIDEAEKGKWQKNLRIFRSLANKQGSIDYPTVQMGDTLLVKFELLSDKEDDHVELIDLPPSGLEPLIQPDLTVFNNHLYFYINKLKKGKNVLEYTVIAKHTGRYNFGLTELTIPKGNIKIISESHQSITIE